MNHCSRRFNPSGNYCWRPPLPGRMLCEKHAAGKVREMERNKAKTGFKMGKPYDHDAHVAREFGLAKGEYARILEDQGGVCAVCKEPCATGRRLAVDHCHTTGVVRGLLCLRCNRAVGYLRDDPAIATSIAAYLMTIRVIGQ